MSADERRPLSGFSVKVTDLEPSSSSKLDFMSKSPANYNPACLTVASKQYRSHSLISDQSRDPSPTSTHGSGSPQTRSHSPFLDQGSPLPPVGESLYYGAYIRTQENRSLTPVMPAPSPTSYSDDSLLMNYKNWVLLSIYMSMLFISVILVCDISLICDTEHCLW